MKDRVVGIKWVDGGDPPTSRPAAACRVALFVPPDAGYSLTRAPPAPDVALVGLPRFGPFMEISEENSR